LLCLPFVEPGLPGCFCFEASTFNGAKLDPGSRAARFTLSLPKGLDDEHRATK